MKSPNNACAPRMEPSRQPPTLSVNSHAGSRTGDVHSCQHAPSAEKLHDSLPPTRFPDSRRRWARRRDPAPPKVPAPAWGGREGGRPCRLYCQAVRVGLWRIPRPAACVLARPRLLALSAVPCSCHLYIPIEMPLNVAGMRGCWFCLAVYRMGQTTVRVPPTPPNQRRMSCPMGSCGR